jgi:hypothetical protein
VTFADHCLLVGWFEMSWGSGAKGGKGGGGGGWGGGGGINALLNKGNSTLDDAARPQTAIVRHQKDTSTGDGEQIDP